MTKEAKRAIKRFCEDYGFDNLKELKEYAKDSYGDILDEHWFRDLNDEECCYNELMSLMPR